MANSSIRQRTAVTATPTAPLTPAAVQAAAQSAAATLNLTPALRFETSDNLPAGTDPRAKAWYDPADGTVHIITDRHTSADDVLRTILHEGAAHAGLRQMLGARFDQFLDRTFRDADPAIRRQIAALAAANRWDIREATEEYLATLAEDGSFRDARAHNFWQTLKTRFKQLLQSLGIRVTLTDADLRYILWRSHETLRRGPLDGAPLRTAADARQRHRLGIPQIRYRFLGEQGAARLDQADSGHRIDDLTRAREMEDQGRDPRDIKQETGWERAADTQWRHETADGDFTPSAASLATRAAREHSALTLPDIWDDPQLYKAYPQAARITVQPITDQEADERGIYGSYGDGNITIRTSDIATPEGRATLIHELQHAIQDTEGHAPGTSEAAARRATDSTFSHIRVIEQQARHLHEELWSGDYQVNDSPDYDSEFQQWYSEQPDGMPQDTAAAIFALYNLDEPSARRFQERYGEEPKVYGQRLYHQALQAYDRLAALRRADYDLYAASRGEVEARNAAARADLTPRQRRDSLASDTEDTPRDAQVPNTSVDDETPEVTAYNNLRFFNSGYNQGLDKLSEDSDPYTAFTWDASPVLRAAGLDLPSGIVISGREILRAAQAAGIDHRDLQNLPDAVSDPIAVFRDPETGQYTVITETERGDRYTTVSLTFGSYGDAYLTILPRDVAPAAIAGPVSDGQVTYIDKGRATLLLDQAQPAPGTPAADTHDQVRQAIDAFRNPVLPALSDAQPAQAGTAPAAAAISESARRTFGTHTQPLGTPGAAAPRTVSDVRDAYDAKIASTSYQVREALQDSMLSLRRYMELTLQAEGSPDYKDAIRQVADYENPYTYENRLSSIDEREAQTWKDLVLTPVLKAIARLNKQGASYPDIENYMMAKHGLERNRVMARREAERRHLPVLRKVEAKLARLADKLGEGTPAYNNSPEVQAALDQRRRLHEAIADDEQLFRARDYAGLTGLTGAGSVTEAETEARRIVDDFEEAHDTAPLWQATGAATKSTLSKCLEGGLLSREAYDDIASMYHYYIPLRGWADTTADQVYGYLSGRSDAAQGNVLKNAKGRRTQADSPIANIGLMGESAIRQANRNMMKQTFLNFALNHPTDLISVSSLWLQHNEATDQWEPVFPRLDPRDTPQQVEAKIQQFELDMQAQAKRNPERYKHGRQAADIPYIIQPGNLREHQVIVKRNGQPYVITVNGNPRLAQAINGASNPDSKYDGALDAVFELGNFVNRNLAQYYTTRNPGFVASNFIRDTAFASTITWAKESPGYALRFHANQARYNPLAIATLLVRFHTQKLDMNNETHRLFKEFMDNGGETGYTQVHDIEKQKTIIAKIIAADRQRIPATIAWQWLGDVLDGVNRSVENAARFAAYATSRQLGRTVGRSIFDAKQISVNFNKKGAGDTYYKANGQTTLGKAAALIAGGGRAGYVFWNASIQGLANISHVARRHPAKTTALAASLFALGMMSNYVGALLAASGGGGDGDDRKLTYLDLPDFTRRSNICFPLYDSDKWCTIPLPVEYQTFYGMGELAMDAMLRPEAYTPKELSVEILRQISQAMPLDLTEGNNPAHALIPSAPKPFAEAYILNQSWTGMPIYRDSPYNKDMPAWTKAYPRNSVALVSLAATLNDWTGGDDFKPGAIDINPARLEYILNGVFGGVAQTLFQAEKGFEKANGIQPRYNPAQKPLRVKGEDGSDWANAPVASRLFKTPDERTRQRAESEDFHRLKDEYDNTGRLMKSYLKATADPNRPDPLRYAQALDYLNHSPEMQRYYIMAQYMPAIEKVDAAIKNPLIPDTEKQPLYQLSDQLKAQMSQAVKQSPR